MSETIAEDTPTHRVRLDEMSIRQQESFLDGIRERRLKALQVYEELLAKRKEAADEKLAVKAGKLAAKLDKHMVALDKAMTALETTIKDAKAMLILIGSEQ